MATPNTVNKRDSVPGRPMRSQAPEWLRGPAALDGEDLVLDRAAAQGYQPISERELVFELAAVIDADAALAFAARYGILRPRGEGKNPRQSLAEFLREAAKVHVILELNRVLGAAVAGERGALRRARDLSATIAKEFRAPSRDDAQMLEQLSAAIADLVNEGGAGTEMRIESAARWEVDMEPDVFMFSAHPRDLLGAAYHHLAMLLVSRAPMRTCEGCGRFFIVEHGRQRFHDETCASRARQRRYRADRRITKARPPRKTRRTAREAKRGKTKR
jgi:hypothetical protein